MTTLTTPTGSKVRSASQRRFVVVVEYTKVVNGAKEHQAFIEKRSDNLATLRTHVSRKGNSFYGDGSSHERIIMDSVTKEVVR